ncbi:MAG: hypothetical protein ACJ711_02130, partial [Ornithinibacter sp.]
DEDDEREDDEDEDDERDDDEREDNEDDDEEREDDEDDPTVELPGDDAAAIVTCVMTVFFLRCLVTTTGFSLAHSTRASWWVLAAAASAAAMTRAFYAFIAAVS